MAGKDAETGKGKGLCPLGKFLQGLRICPETSRNSGNTWVDPALNS